ncbi:hypothetical protein [Pelagibius marinus]|uniref:hypothetical protein n=1 Tax=Pelagibius marinus TaxID=2762760 RepID=UPI001872B3C9|nr:hypothetical protein [Pelagibius marinus]
MGIRQVLLPAGLALLLGACTSTGGGKYDEMMAERGVAGASRDAFIVCHGHGCRLRAQLDFSEQEWAPVADLFAEPAESAAVERERIGAAIGLIEAAAGRRAGTSRDVGGTLNAFGVAGGGKTGFDGQFDCYDETTNTSTYLTLLAEAGYLKWHRIDGWAKRGSLIGSDGWPHQTAVIVELQSQRAYAVDSWFEDNGHAAYMVPLEEWYAGWVPPGFTDSPF